MKICRKCKIEKKFEFFKKAPKSLKTKDEYMSRCIPCSQEDRRNKYIKNKKDEQFIKKTKEYYLNNKEAFLKRYYEDDKRSYLKYKYNVTPEFINKMLDRQDGCCAICFKPGKLFIDHDHSCCSTSKSCGNCIRGLLCNSCNSGIGQLKESVDIFYSALNYLNI